MKNNNLPHYKFQLEQQKNTKENNDMPKFIILLVLIDHSFMKLQMITYMDNVKVKSYLILAQDDVIQHLILMERLQRFSREVRTQTNCLQRYRKQSVIDPHEFKSIIYGKHWYMRDRAFQFTKKNSHLRRYFHQYELPRFEQRKLATQLFLQLYKVRDLGFDDYKQNPNIFSSYSTAMFSISPGFAVKNGVSIFLYFKTLDVLGTDDHRDFNTRAKQLVDIGCFALTQATHGSNVKGLLTEAHYDHSTKEFIIHSPNRDAMKFWIGAAANVANIAAVWAQLYIDGKCHGVHVYLVPLRDPKSHETLPGITIGDCGPKNGLNDVDNGFILFDNVRIPRINQLGRISGVDSNGKFYTTISSEEKRFGLQLAALSGGRAYLAANTPCIAINALAIAVRYTCSRRQFSAPGNDKQTFLFDYPLTQYRLVPFLAQSVVYQAGGIEFVKQWDDSTNQLLNQHNPAINELHALCSVLKPKSTWFAAEVLKQCRQMLGGHGYSAYSRVGSMYHDNDINCTFEGDNTILLQQTTKYVLESAQGLTIGKQVEVQSLKFLNNIPSIQDSDLTYENLQDLDYIEKVFQQRVYKKIESTGLRLLELKTQGQKIFDIWNGSQVFHGFNLALYYGDLFYLRAAKKCLARFRNDPSKKVFEDCIRLWIFKTLEQQSINNSSTARKIIQQLVREYTFKLAKEAVSIIDILAAPSQVIASPWADQNGNGLQKYIGLVTTGKNTFKKIDWSDKIKNMNIQSKQ